MITLKSLNGRSFCLNSDLIYKIEELPDTIITLSDGKTIRVVENTDVIVKKIIEYKRKIFFGLPEASSK